MFLYSKWTELPITARIKLANDFGIPRIRSVHVSDNRIVDDGYDLKAVEKALAVEKLQVYLNSKETDTDKLWELLVAKAEGRETVATQEETFTILPQEEQAQFNKEYEDRTGLKAPSQELPKKKRGRPKKIR